MSVDLHQEWCVWRTEPESRMESWGPKNTRKEAVEELAYIELCHNQARKSAEMEELSAQVWKDEGLFYPTNESRHNWNHVKNQKWTIASRKVSDWEARTS